MITLLGWRSTNCFNHCQHRRRQRPVKTPEHLRLELPHPRARLPEVWRHWRQFVYNAQLFQRHNFFFRRRDFRRYVGIPPEEIDIESIWEEKLVENLASFTHIRLNCGLLPPIITGYFYQGNGAFFVEYDIPPPQEPEPFEMPIYDDDGVIGTINDTIQGLPADRIESCSSHFLGFFIKVIFLSLISLILLKIIRSRSMWF